MTDFVCFGGDHKWYGISPVKLPVHYAFWIVLKTLEVKWDSIFKIRDYERAAIGSRAKVTIYVIIWIMSYFKGKENEKIPIGHRKMARLVSPPKFIQCGRTRLLGIKSEEKWCFDINSKLYVWFLSDTYKFKPWVVCYSDYIQKYLIPFIWMQSQETKTSQLWSH
jgi:hypothetical protein